MHIFRYLGTRWRAIAMLGLWLATTPALAADIVNGGELYRRHCVSCHGANGVPLMHGAPDFTRQTALLVPDPVLLRSIRDGKNAMPGYRGLLKDHEIMDVIVYLRTLR